MSYSQYDGQYGHIQDGHRILGECFYKLGGVLFDVLMYNKSLTVLLFGLMRAPVFWKLPCRDHMLGRTRDFSLCRIHSLLLGRSTE